jgi:hypothetical protein
MKTLLLIILLAIVATADFVRSKRQSNPVPFEGDIDPDTLGEIEAINALAGDIDDDYEDDDDLEGDLGYEGDPDDDDDDYDYDETEDVLGDILSGDVVFDDVDPNTFMSGDVDDEEADSTFDMGDFGEGGFFNKIFRRKKKRSRRSSRGRSKRSSYRRTAPRYASTIRKFYPPQKTTAVGFHRNLVARKMAKRIVRSKGSMSRKMTQLKQLQTMANTPGALTAKFNFSRIAVTGGTIKISETDLKIPGDNLATAVKLWELYSPGRSRSITQNASATGTLSFVFTEPSGEELSKVLPIFMYLQAANLTKVHFAEMGLSITGKDINGNALSFTKDRIALFTHPEQKQTTVAFIPTKQIKQILYASQFNSPTTADPITVTLTGLPEGTNVTVRLAGNDTKDWVDYKKMIGLQVRKG